MSFEMYKKMGIHVKSSTPRCKNTIKNHIRDMAYGSHAVKSIITLSKHTTISMRSDTIPVQHKAMRYTQLFHRPHTIMFLYSHGAQDFQRSMIHEAMNRTGLNDSVCFLGIMASDEPNESRWYHMGSLRESNTTPFVWAEVPHCDAETDCSAGAPHGRHCTCPACHCRCLPSKQAIFQRVTETFLASTRMPCPQLTMPAGFSNRSPVVV